MRALRNTLRLRWRLVRAATAIGVAALGGNALASAAPANSYLPLAVGNTWTYACSAEGQPQFRKTLKILSVTATPLGRMYRSELVVGMDPKPVVSYYVEGSDGKVSLSTHSDAASAVPVISAQPRVGEAFGALKVAELAKYEHGRFKNTPAARLENFSQDDPRLSEDKRLGWIGRIYGRGVGLLEEADGLGGACVLTTLRLRKP